MSIQPDNPELSKFFDSGRPVEIKWTEANPETRLKPGAVTESVDHIQGAKKMLVDYINSRLETTDEFKIDESYIYVVWFSYVLGNWKMVASTSLPDRMYYEVTHNEAFQKTYIDAYLKVDNRMITHV